MASVTVIAAYDVREDDRRSRLAATLQVHGDRIQKSVFVLTLDADDLSEVVERARMLIDPDHDSFQTFRQCATCWEETICVGQATVQSPSLCWIVG